MGFDVELVDKAAKKEANVCPHCKLILEEPIQTDEGIRLCKSCLQDIKRYEKGLFVSYNDLHTWSFSQVRMRNSLYSKPGGACSCCGVKVAEGQVRTLNVLPVFLCCWVKSITICLSQLDKGIEKRRSMTELKEGVVDKHISHSWFLLTHEK